MSTVLVIDDTQDAFDLVADALDGTCQLQHVRTGPAGLAAAHAARPDLILLDMSLPEMTGWDVVRHLKADAQTAGIPVVAVTAHAMNGDRQRCLAAGCDEYLPKPIDVQALVELVGRYLDAAAPEGVG